MTDEPDLITWLRAKLDNDVSPTRWWDEVDAKRQRLDWIMGELRDDPDDETAQWLAKLEALPYAGRDGYREEWRPSED